MKELVCRRVRAVLVLRPMPGPSDVPLFIVAQIAGAWCATLLFRWLVPNLSARAGQVVMRHCAALDSLEESRYSIWFAGDLKRQQAVRRDC
jgi:glycerol uptake facilitator-like aquaporin